MFHGCNGYHGHHHSNLGLWFHTCQLVCSRQRRKPLNVIDHECALHHCCLLHQRSQKKASELPCCLHVHLLSVISTVASHCHLCWGLLWYKSTFFFFLLERLSWLSIPFLEGKQTKQKLKWWQKQSWVTGEGEFSPLLITLEGRDSKLASEKRNTNLKKSQQSVSQCEVDCCFLVVLFQSKGLCITPSCWDEGVMHPPIY